MDLHSTIDPVVTFLNLKEKTSRGTVLGFQRKNLVMKMYRPDFLQMTEVIPALTIKQNSREAYAGREIVNRQPGKLVELFVF